MASTDRKLLEDVTIEVSDGESTPSDLEVCFTNVTYTTEKTYADVTESCDTGFVEIPSSKIRHNFSFQFYWEGDANAAHTRLYELGMGVGLADYTFTLPDGATLEFSAYTKIDLFSGGSYNEGLRSSVELRCVGAPVYTAA